MEGNQREVDALSLFGIVLGSILLILCPGTGCYAIVMGWTW
jgi:hypothetical protein